ncbi:MAG TPA: FAD-dependent oxidoreductase, partial [Acidimicrobiales bacterium]|nr:FAD-dependent oxidoreductase [Acidimicrobiales bacterium]
MSARGSGSPLSADCVVVGGGLVGTALAYELACRGRETVLVDRQDPGRATDAGAGILSPETSLDPDPCAHAMGMAA